MELLLQVGRAAWTFLHALAAQYPDKPSRQQVRDVTNLVSRSSQLLCTHKRRVECTSQAGVGSSAAGTCCRSVRCMKDLPLYNPLPAAAVGRLLCKPSIADRGNLLCGVRKPG